MKKIISMIATITLLSVLIFEGKTFAASLDTINVQINKTTVRPGEEVTVTIQFGQDLGAYTFDISYDNNIFEYVSADGGTPSDTTDKVRVVYHDSTGGTNPRTNMSVTFRAKSDITTSNPTEFMVTAEGLANADGSVTFDDITTPIEKNLTVEPQYIDYTLDLKYTGDIIKEQEKEITISYSSPMGHYYEHARLIAEATTPDGASVKLLATEQSLGEQDIIQSGFGDPQGYKIGGKDVSQVLNARGIFSKEGSYNITLKLIDKDNSDSVIAEKTFNLTVNDGNTQAQPTENEGSTEITPPEEEKEEQTEEEVKKEIKEETKTEQENTNEIPTKLPKTGINVYIPIIITIVILESCYLYYNKKK